MFQDFGGPSSIFTIANSTGFHTGLLCAPIVEHTKTVSNKNAVARQKLVIVSFAPTGFAGRSAITSRQSVQTPRVGLQMLLELYVIAEEPRTSRFAKAWQNPLRRRAIQSLV